MMILTTRVWFLLLAMTCSLAVSQHTTDSVEEPKILFEDELFWGRMLQTSMFSGSMPVEPGMLADDDDIVPPPPPPFDAGGKTGKGTKTGKTSKGGNVSKAGKVDKAGKGGTLKGDTGLLPKGVEGGKAGTGKGNPGKTVKTGTELPLLKGDKGSTPPGGTEPAGTGRKTLSEVVQDPNEIRSLRGW